MKGFAQECVLFQKLRVRNIASRWIRSSACAGFYKPARAMEHS